MSSDFTSINVKIDPNIFTCKSVFLFPHNNSALLVEFSSRIHISEQSVATIAEAAKKLTASTFSVFTLNWLINTGLLICLCYNSAMATSLNVASYLLLVLLGMIIRTMLTRKNFYLVGNLQYCIPFFIFNLHRWLKQPRLLAFINTLISHCCG